MSTSSVRRILTDRRGGASTGVYSSFNLGDHVGDDPAAVTRNRARLARSLGLPPERVVWMDQVHGTHVATVDGENVDGPVPETDGLVTTAPNLALAVLTADCVPVLASDAEAGVIGAAHAGRVGATGGVVAGLVRTMISLGATPGNIEVLLGPAAAGKHYELPADMAAEVERDLPGSRTTTVAGTAGVDLRAGLVRQLEQLGVLRVRADPRCTIADENLFSYRRDGQTGRQASVIVRTEKNG